MMSLIHLAYVRDDYSEAAVEIADLSAAEKSIRTSIGRVKAPRMPRVIPMPADGPIARDLLQTEIQDVYRILMSLAEE